MTILQDDPAQRRLARTARRLEATESADAWPHTGRPLPWLIAAMMVVLVLTPFDSMRLPGSLPAEPRLDRILVLLIGVIWLLVLATPGRGSPRWKPLGLVGVGVALLACTALISVVLNEQTLWRLGQTQTSVKNLALLLSYLGFFVLATTIVRPEEIRSYVKLLVFLGAICGIGVAYQYRSQVNVFFEWAQSIFGGVAVIDPPPVKRFVYERDLIAGPAQHGLAVTAMLSMILPLALACLMEAKGRRNQILYGLATAAIFIGALSTVRRSAVVLPAVAIAVFIAYRPRRMLRFWPLGLAGLVGMKLFVPGVVTNLREQFAGQNTLAAASTEGRTTDYAAVLPNFLHQPIMGRGYGSYSPSFYRFLDNQYIGVLLEVGLIGLGAYVLVILGAAYQAHSLQRPTTAGWSALGMAGVAVTATFAVGNALFDALGFGQAPYVFLLVTALIVVSRQVAPSAISS